MINKENPFVVSSGVYEITNNIVVGVTTTDEVKLYVRDTIGGATKVKFSPNTGTEDLLVRQETE